MHTPVSTSAEACIAWSGHVVHGDRASIEAVRLLLQDEGRCAMLENEVRLLRRMMLRRQSKPELGL